MFKRKRFNKRKGFKKTTAGKRKFASRRPRTNMSRLMSTNGGLTYSSFNLASRATGEARAITKITQPNIYVVDDGQNMVSSNGRQEYQAFQSLTRANIQSMMNNITPVAISALAPNQAPPSRAVIESLDSQLTLSNNTNFAQELTLYDVVLKRDIMGINLIRIGWSGNNQLWSLNGANGCEDFILQGCRAGTGQTTADSTDSSRYVGSLPYDSQFFRDYFKVVKRTEVLLSPGGSHRHLVSLKPNKLVDQSIAGNEDLAGIKGLTYMTLCYTRGIAGYDIASSLGTTPGLITSIVHTQRIKFSWVADGGARIYPYSTIPTPETGIKVRNPGSGVYEVAGQY